MEPKRQRKKLTQKQIDDESEASFTSVNRFEDNRNKQQIQQANSIKEYSENNSTFNGEKAGTNYQYEVDNEKIPLGLKLITTNKLISFFSSNKRESQGLFPELIGKLVKESARSKLKKVCFPSGDNVALQGCDGEVLSNEENNLFIPNGKSLWELGASTSDKGKIEKDFKKRNKTFSLEQKKESTFVLVTPQIFTQVKKDEMLREFNNCGWKEVKIYDGQTLEEWLEQCVSTACWLLNKMTHSNLSFKSFYDAYFKLENKTYPKLSSKLFTINRSNEVDKFFELLGNKKIIKVAGPTFEESYNFVLSAFYESNDDFLKSKVIICEDIDTLNRLDVLLEDKILILATSVNSLTLVPNNRCIFLFSINGIYLNVDIEISKRPKSVVCNVLRNEMNISEDKIMRLSNKASNNISAIIRELSSDGNIELIHWTTDKRVYELIPAMLVGKINAANDCDKKVLSNFLFDGNAVEKYISKLDYWRLIEDSPISFYGDTICVSLKEDLWHCVSNAVNSNYVSKLKDLVINIFNNHNTKCDLFSEKSFLYGICKGGYVINDYIIDGLLDSCILLTIYNGKQDEMNALTNSVLQNIQTKEQLLIISKYFKYFAELAPEVFINYLNDEIANNDSFVMSLFDESGAKYCTLLHSLELLAQFDDTKVRACNLLLKLHLKNYNYYLDNTPANSLISNLLPICNNALTYKNKLDLTLKYLDEYGELFFDISESLISPGGKILYTDYPKFKDFSFKEEATTQKKLNDYLKQIVLKELEVCKEGKIRLINSLLNNYIIFSAEILDIIKQYIFGNFVKDEGDSFILYELLVKSKYAYVMHFNKRRVEYLDNYFNELIEFVKPVDYLDSNLIYFDGSDIGCYNAELIDDDFYINQENQKRFLKDLFSELYKGYDHKELFEKLLKVLPDNYYSGSFLASQNLNNEDLALIEEFAKKYRKLELMVNFFYKSGETIYNDFVNNLSKEELKQIIPFISNFSIVPSVIMSDSELIEQFFIKRSYFEDLKDEDKLLIKKYNPISYLRFLCTVNEIGFYDLREALNILVGLDISTNEYKKHSWVLKKILKIAENYVSGIEVFKLELKFFSIYNYNEIPTGIQAFVFDNPNIFIEIFKRNSSHKEFKFRFYSYLSFPDYFKSEEGKVHKFVNNIMEYETLNDGEIHFIREALGGVLARSYKSEANCFIPNDLKKLLEEIKNDDVNRGVYFAYENLKGVRFIGDGSDELEKAKKLKEELLECEIKYSQAASILRGIMHESEKLAVEDKNVRTKLNDV